MSEQNWIPLTDYSTKHRVSISTLRRRIKAESIPYRFESGKYFLLDQPMQTHQTTHRPSQLRAQLDWAPQLDTRDREETATRIESEYQETARETEESPAPKSPPLLTTAQTLLAEIKQAYTQILQEKEEQIMQLKDQLNDMRTLIKILENENARLTSQSSQRQLGKAPKLEI